MRKKPRGSLRGALSNRVFPGSCSGLLHGDPALELGLAQGKKIHDKRDTSKERDWNRQKQRLLRDRG